MSTKESVILLDVREADEFANGSIEGAINMPMGKVFVETTKNSLPKDKKIVTMCRTGGRGGIVARELKEMGYDIETLEGGLESWKQFTSSQN